MRQPALVAKVVLCCLGLTVTACAGAPRPLHGPSPTTTIRPVAADVQLGEQDDGTSVSATVGETIGLRLHDDGGAIGSLEWVDPAVLSTARVSRAGNHDLSALYRAVGAGQAEIIINRPCSGTACSAALRYSVRVVVS